MGWLIVLLVVWVVGWCVRWLVASGLVGGLVGWLFFCLVSGLFFKLVGLSFVFAGWSFRS